ncbi:MAG: tetratricopeptide repeat protein [Myxococcales bacterium]|nr:tetratricopeptide repeat protein [Myxococcales bacterium]
MRTASPVIALLLWLPAALPCRAAASSANEEMERGDAWAELGNWQRALEHFRRACADKDAPRAARLRLANALYRTGDRDGALQELARFTASGAERAPVACARGNILLDLGRAADACRSFEEARAADPKEVRAFFGMCRCRAALAELPGAAESVRQEAKRSCGEFAEKFPADRRVPVAREALAVLTFGEAGRLLSRAREEMAGARWKEAEALLKKALEQKPDLEEAHYLLGLTLTQPAVNRTEEAQASFQRAPGHPQAWLQRGLFAFARDDLELAIEAFQKAISLDANLAEAHYQLGLTYQTLLKEDEARQAFAEVARLVPDSPLGRQARSRLGWMTGNLNQLSEGQAIDAAAEVELGHKVAALLEKQMGRLDDPALQERLDRILRRIAANTDRLPEAVPYKVQLINLDTVNALSFSGGTILLFRGLIDFIRNDLGDTDDAYAAVLGHEVAHVALRHGMGMLHLASEARELLQGQAFDVRNLEKLVVGLSRHNEFEADQLGSLYSYRAGFDPSAGMLLHRRFVEKGMEVPENRDHPTHSQRERELREYLLSLRAKARHFEAGVAAFDKRDYVGAATHFEIFVGLFPASAAGRNNLALSRQQMGLAWRAPKVDFRLSTDLDPRFRPPPIVLRAGEVKDPARPLLLQAAEEFREILRRDRAYLPARINLASCVLHLGDPLGAEKILEEALRLAPDAAGARNNLAVARLKQNRPQGVLEELRALSQQNPNLAEARFNLALLLQQQGKSDESRREWLAYLKLDPDSGFAEQARKQIALLK